MIYEMVEPFGDRRGDIQAGMVSASIWNVQRTKESDKIWNPSDFIPKWNPEPAKPTQTPEEAMAIFLGIQAAQNAIVAAQQQNGLAR
jgi:hypothetical protein